MGQELVVFILLGAEKEWNTYISYPQNFGWYGLIYVGHQDSNWTSLQKAIKTTSILFQTSLTHIIYVQHESEITFDSLCLQN